MNRGKKSLYVLSSADQAKRVKTSEKSAKKVAQEKPGDIMRRLATYQWDLKAMGRA